MASSCGRMPRLRSLHKFFSKTTMSCHATFLCIHPTEAWPMQDATFATTGQPSGILAKFQLFRSGIQKNFCRYTAKAGRFRLTFYYSKHKNTCRLRKCRHVEGAQKHRLRKCRHVQDAQKQNEFHLSSGRNYPNRCMFRTHKNKTNFI